MCVCLCVCVCIRACLPDSSDNLKRMISIYPKHKVA